MTWATDELFVAGGDFIAEQWPEVQAQTGVTVIVSVTAERPGLFSDPLPWAWLWLPVADEAAYTLEHLELGAQFIAGALAARRTVLLHGPRGMHRVRPLVAAHLLTTGQTLPRVLREMERRPWLPPYKGDPELLRQFAQRKAEG